MARWGTVFTDVKIRKAVIFFTMITLMVFAFGITIGYIFGSKMPQNVTQAIRNSCGARSIQTDDGQLYLERTLQREEKLFSCVHEPGECWDYGLPRNYVAFHLGEKTITIDGRLDDEAWTEVPWSEEFEDLRNFIYPKPFYASKFKMRWDDDHLYIGVYLQEKDLWATHREHDSGIYRDNALEIFINTDGAMFNYKQVDINAFGAILDLAMYKYPYDTTFKNSTDVNWHSHAEKAIHFEGSLNTPGDEDTYWSVELSIPFKTLAERSERVKDEPEDTEVWFVQFGRSQPNITVENGTYELGPYFYWHWWAWQPCFAYNTHLPDRWGLIQFKRNTHDSKFYFSKWHIYRALFDVYDALQKYKAINGFYTYEVEALDVPAYLWSRACVDIPVISYDTSEVNVTVHSMILPGTSANISSDKVVTFD